MEKATKIYTIGLLVIMPLVVSPFLGEPYYRGKIVWTTIITLFYGLILIKSRSIQVKKGIGHILAKPKDFTVEWVLMVMLVLATLSFLGSKDLWIGFYGWDNAPEGLLVIGLYLIIYYISYKLPLPLKALQDFIMGTGVVVALFAILEYRGLIPYISSRLLDVWFYREYYATIGNQNFLGTYGVILFAFAMGTALYSKHYRGFFYSGIFFVLIMISQTRSAYVAAFVVFISAGILSYGQDRPRYKFRLLLLFLTLLVFLILGYQVVYKGDSRVIERVYLLLYDLVHYSDAGAGTGRMGIWMDTVGFLLSKPLLGYGPDAFGQAYALAVGPMTTTYEKAHNEWLQMIVTLGLPYFSLYMVLVVKAFKGVLNKMAEDPFYKTVLLILLGYMVQGQFNISVFPTAVFLYSLMGLSAKEAL